MRHLAPLAWQILTEGEQQRLQRFGANGDAIDASAWPKWTGSVENRPATAKEVLGGMRGAAVAAGPNSVANRGRVAA